MAKEPKAVRIRHKTDRNCVRVTPLFWRPQPKSPQQGFPVCNLCKIIHYHKAIHLWVGPDGDVIISADLWPELQKVGNGDGMEAADGFTLTGAVDDPPPLTLGRHGERERVDNENRAQVAYHPNQLSKEAS